MLISRKNFERDRIPHWKLRKFTHFWQNFRESNVFTTEVNKGLISREKFGEREFRAFHNVRSILAQCEVYDNFVPLFLIKNSVQSTCFLNCFTVD